MFVRDCWKPHSVDEIYQLIDDNPWAMLISHAEHGPLGTNLPLLLDRSEGQGIISGHLARGNEHAELLFRENTPLLAVFQGPYSYVTGSWYPKRDMPSTVYYTLVHCYGFASPMTDDVELGRSVEELTQRMEAAYENGWKTTDIPESAITRRLRHIVGFRLRIDRLEAKFKLGQDEPRKDALAVADQLAARSRPEDTWLVETIRRYNQNRPSD